MPGEYEEAVVMGHRYRMKPLGFVTSRQVSMRLMPPFLISMGDAMAKVDPSKGLAGMSMADLGGLVAAGGRFMRELGDESAAFVTDKMAEQTLLHHSTGDATPPTWTPLSLMLDQHFKQGLDKWLAWLFWGVQVNRFLGAFSDRLAKLSAEAQAHFASPTGSTGTAGA